jgi:hypothetical protein
MIPPKYTSEECKHRRHSDCDGWVPRGYDEPYDHPCDDLCHKPNRTTSRDDFVAGHLIEKPAFKHITNY